MREALPDDFFHIVKEFNHPEYPWLGTTLGTMILGTWYWCTDQVIVQKTLSARSLPHAQGGCDSRFGAEDHAGVPLGAARTDCQGSLA